MDDPYGDTMFDRCLADISEMEARSENFSPEALDSLIRRLRICAGDKAADGAEFFLRMAGDGGAPSA